MLACIECTYSPPALGAMFRFAWMAQGRGPHVAETVLRYKWRLHLTVDRRRASQQLQRQITASSIYNGVYSVRLFVLTRLCVCLVAFSQLTTPRSSRLRRRCPFSCCSCGSCSCFFRPRLRVGPTYTGERNLCLYMS